jgi:flagellum-specific peptidoglycan hydrolase FlgJ
MPRFIAIWLLCAFAIACPIVSAQDPLPEYYGVYALQDGKLIELVKDSTLNDFSPTVRFVVYLRGKEQPLDKIFFLPPDKPKDIGSKEFKGWDDFYRQSQEFGAALDMMLRYGVPANAREIPYRLGPYGRNNEMMRVVPVKELAPGFYQLLKDVRFWIRRAEVQQLYSQAATTQQTAGNAGAGSAKQPTAASAKSAPFDSSAPPAPAIGASPQPSAIPRTALPPPAVLGQTGSNANTINGSPLVTQIRSLVASAEKAGRFQSPLDDEQLLEHIVEESDRVGIPIWLLFGQARFETTFGNPINATTREGVSFTDGSSGNAHNLFNIRPGASWVGKVLDTGRGGQFRVYGSYDECVSDYLQIMFNNYRGINLIAIVNRYFPASENGAANVQTYIDSLVTSAASLGFTVNQSTIPIL